jgi:hypothetical protein
MLKNKLNMTNADTDVIYWVFFSFFYLCLMHNRWPVGGRASQTVYYSSVL